MYWYMHDPQTEVGHACTICRRECFGESDICQRCADHMNNDEIEWED